MSENTPQVFDLAIQVYKCNYYLLCMHVCLCIRSQECADEWMYVCRCL